MVKILVRDPVYQQLGAALRDMLKGYCPGQKFISERQVSAKFDVSRATANKALSNLVIEGVLIFRKGVGTFVSGDAMHYDLRSLVSFTHKAQLAGKKPSTKVLQMQSVKAVDADPQVVKTLKLSGDESLKYVERLRLVDGQPVILERRHIVMRRCGSFGRKELGGSLYKLFTDRFRLDIAGAEETISAVNIGDNDADNLDVVNGSAGLLVVATGYLSDDEPLWFERTLYRGDAYTFHNRTGTIRTARPAVGTLCQIDG